MHVTRSCAQTCKTCQHQQKRRVCAFIPFVLLRVVIEK
jgi:hypothetical protein